MALGFWLEEEEGDRNDEARFTKGSLFNNNNTNNIL